MTESAEHIAGAAGLGREAGSRALARLAAGVAVALALSAAGPGTAARVEALAELGRLPDPYLVPAHAGLLYLGMPLVALAGCTAIMAPGMLLALALGGARLGLLALLLQGFALTAAGLPVAAELADALGGALGRGPATGGAFVALLAMLSAAALLLVARADRAGRVAWGVARGRGIDLAVMLAVPLLALLAMTPKFYWESLNGDGAEIHLAARLLIARPLPFWPPGPDTTGYPAIGVLLEVLANSWFVRLFGEVPLASRLPALLGLGLLAGVLLGLIRLGVADRTRPGPAVAVGAALLLYAWVMAYQPAYDPHFADIASPMTREPFALIALLGMMAFWLDWRPGWFAAFVILLSVALPSAGILVLLWLGASAVTTAPRPWRRLATGLLALAAAVAIGKLVPAALAATGLIGGADEFSARNLAGRLRFVTLSEPERLAWWVIPCGLVPALSLLAWPLQDRVGRAVSILTLAYALFFTVQAYRVLPHHLAPAMVLPLLVYWRLDPVRRHPGAATAVALAGLAAAVPLARPASFAPDMAARDFGAALAIDYPRSGAFDPAELNAVRELMREGLPPHFGEGDAARFASGSPWAWFIHAQAPKRPGQPIAYRILQDGDPARPGEVEVAAHGGYRLLAASAEAHAAALARGSAVRSMNDLFYVRREVLFGRGARGGPRPVWDLARLGGAAVSGPVAIAVAIRPGARHPGAAGAVSGRAGPAGPGRTGTEDQP